MMTLWILFCRMTEKRDMLYSFYARDREDAERQAQAFLSEHPIYSRIDLKAFPGGFVIHHTCIPGTMEEGSMY